MMHDEPIQNKLPKSDREQHVERSAEKARVSHMTAESLANSHPMGKDLAS